MTINAVYENGVYRPLEHVALPDNCQVAITVQSPDQAPQGRPLMRLVEIAHAFPDDANTPTDAAANVDHYLYGAPKQS
jgi:predicted DNA-binding antitoxin AbrB/MazE fold protein